MTGAELKTIRESLNLSAQELSDRLGIRSNRTVRFWESREGRPIPPGVEDAVLAWDRDVEHAALATASAFSGPTSTLYRVERGSDPPFDDLPHARRLEHAALARARRHLEARGVSVSIRHA